MNFAARTIWIYQVTRHHWRAVDHKGREFATGKFGSHVESSVRQRISRASLDIVSVAMVVSPTNRQPNRRVVITRPMRAAGVLPYHMRK